MIDERQLTTQQMVKFLSILFNTQVNKVPDPEFDWHAFEKWVIAENSKVAPTFNPMSQKVEEWINISNLRKVYNPNAVNPAACCSIQ